MSYQVRAFEYQGEVFVSTGSILELVAYSEDITEKQREALLKVVEDARSVVKKA